MPICHLLQFGDSFRSLFVFAFVSLLFWILYSIYLWVFEWVLVLRIAIRSLIGIHYIHTLVVRQCHSIRVPFFSQHSTCIKSQTVGWKTYLVAVPKLSNTSHTHTHHIPLCGTLFLIMLIQYFWHLIHRSCSNVCPCLAGLFRFRQKQIWPVTIGSNTSITDCGWWVETDDGNLITNVMRTNWILFWFFWFFFYSVRFVSLFFRFSLFIFCFSWWKKI